jgi:thioredoxin 1
MYTHVESLPQELSGPLTVLDFGTNWCGYCQTTKPWIQKVASQYPYVHYVQIEDGKGRRLGRLHLVKLWPTLIFLKDGQEVARLVRPDDPQEIELAFAQLNSAK